MRTFTTNDLLFLIDAAQYTLLLSIASLLLGGLLAIGVCLLRLSKDPVSRIIGTAIVTLGQGIPPLVLLFLSYFGLALSGINVSAFGASCLALSFFTAVYLGEIWRSSINALHKEQWEAAESLAMSWGQQMIYVIVPQAIKMALPPSIGFIVQLVKNTSLASIVGVLELTKAGQMVNNATFQSFEVFLVVSLLYFAICFPLSVLSRRLEARLLT